MVLRVQLAEVWCYDESAGQLLEYGSVAKMVIVPACHAGDHGFKSRRSRHMLHWRRGLTHLTFYQTFSGSNPLCSTNGLQRVEA